jgi:hypothetical protein
MAREVGQIVRRGARTWLVRVYHGRNPETNKRKYLNQTVYGTLRDAQARLNKMHGERDRGRNLDSSKQTLNEFLDRWLELLRQTAAAREEFSRLRRPAAPIALDIQALYRGLLDRHLSARSIRYTHAVLRSALKSRPSGGVSFWGIPQTPSIYPGGIGGLLPSSLFNRQGPS